ncbi:MAG: DUF58 domain-containing protein [Deltaproteobacteria bacterium]|nr:DUF58 domain-containing protein [Deltaproteobacteria bacterium]
MNLRPAISAPLPWLIILFGKLFGKKTQHSGKRIFRFPRTLNFTREGKWFLGILLFIGVAAINTGNNLLYLVVATLLSLIIISGIMSESTLRGVRASRLIKGYVFKGSPAIAAIKVENTKKLLPSFSFSIKEVRATRLKSDPAYVLKLKPGERITKTAEYVFEHRGRHTLEAISIYTRFPFGIFIKGKVEDSAEDVIVLPSIKLKKAPRLLEDNSASGSRDASSRGDGTQLYGLRDYTLQDDARHIHWMSAGRLQKVLLKEFEKDREKKVLLFIDNYSSSEEAFEETVDEAASFANHFSERGYSVGLKALNLEIKPAQGRAHLYKILHALALITPAAQKGTPCVRVISG